MENRNIPIKILQAKILITANLKILTGMHIGGSSTNAAIGAVDSIIIRDPLTRQPVIPGSSLKGKMRTLLAKFCNVDSNGVLNEPNKDAEQVKHLFGSSKPIQASCLQFFDIFMTDKSIENIETFDTDLYLTEIKYENAITRSTAVANPRQIERIPAGAIFAFKLIYNYETGADLEKDFAAIKYGFNLLEDDYLGGHGSRGYGRVKFENLDAEIVFKRDKFEISKKELKDILESRESS